MSLLITFATIQEAEKTIAILSAHATAKNPYLYTFEQGVILITGIGSFATICALESYYEGQKEILSLGLAGSLQSNLEIGAIYPVARCTKFLWHPRGNKASQECASYGVLDELTLSSTGLKLLTTDMPLYNALERPEELVDMEGYAIAHFAKKRTIPCHMYRIVSDYCTSETSRQIRERLPQFSETLSHYVVAQTSPTPSLQC